jgi:hypothetical protein
MEQSVLMKFDNSRHGAVFAKFGTEGIPLSYVALPVSVVEVEVNLRPTVSRRLGVGLLSGAHGQIFVFCLTIAGFLMCGTLSDERTGL